MRVALVSPYDFAVPSGVNSHIRELARELRGRDHHVSVFAPGNAEMSTEAGVHLIGRSFPVPSGGSLARVTLSPRSGAWTRRQLDEGQFDVIHLHEPLVPILPLQFLRLARVPKVGTFHTARDGGSRLYFLNHRWLRRYAKLLDGRVAVSRAAAELVSRYFPGTYRVIPNGLDIQHFAHRCEPDERLGAFGRYILFVGRFEERKGLDVLLDAFAMLKARFSDLHLVVVGDARRRTRYEDIVQEMGLADVHFAGYVPNDQLPAYYQRAAAFCAPNTGNESFGRILPEAMAAGTPIVASRIKGFTDVVTDEVDGLLVPPGDAEALSRALERVLEDKALAGALTQRGTKTVQRYSWQVVTDELVAFYEEVIRQAERRVDSGAAAK
ncbi:MAG TPA: glycosyltransferase family 4 protein [Tepidiformaceae bacterium]|nr:glycosyltransferase family 4 protein [Tepidiformaceae bacterium]